MYDDEQAEECPMYDGAHNNGTEVGEHPTSTAADGAAADAMDVENTSYGEHTGLGNGNTETQNPAFHQQSHGIASQGSHGNTATRHSSPGRSRPRVAEHDYSEGRRRHSGGREWSGSGRQGGGEDKERQGRGDKEGVELSAAAMARQQVKALHKRRAEVVELYSGVVALAMKPRREDIADSCFVSGGCCWEQQWQGEQGTWLQVLSVLKGSRLCLRMFMPEICVLLSKHHNAALIHLELTHSDQIFMNNCH